MLTIFIALYFSFMFRTIYECFHHCKSEKVNETNYIINELLRNLIIIKLLINR
jgi:hypothetical protein